MVGEGYNANEKQFYHKGKGMARFGRGNLRVKEKRVNESKMLKKNFTKHQNMLKIIFWAG